MSKEDQQVFDRLFDRAKFHIHAGVYLARSWPMETILVPICLEHGKMIEEILLFVLAACRSDGAAAKMIKPPDEDLEWTPTRLFRLLKKMTLKETPEELTQDEARKSLEGLKKMRGRTANWN